MNNTRRGAVARTAWVRRVSYDRGFANEAIGTLPFGTIYVIESFVTGERERDPRLTASDSPHSRIDDAGTMCTTARKVSAIS